MKKLIVESIAGIFIFLGLIAVVYLSFNLGETPGLKKDSYTLVAEFQSVGGLKKGNRVMIAGVEVGKIEHIFLNPKNFIAEVTFSVDKSVLLEDDTIASIKTNGLIGDKFLSLNPGGSGIVLEPGDLLYETESALDIESLIKKYAFGNVKK